MARYSHYSILTILALTLAQSAAAQGGRSFADAEQSSVPYTKTTARAEASCAALTSLTNYDYLIISATLIEASDEAPEYCRVLGVIPAEIRFSVDLPTDWNRRLYMHGNGGFAGTPPDAPNRIRSSRPEALSRASPTSPRTSSVTTLSRIACTSTTCTRRSFT